MKNNSKGLKGRSHGAMAISHRFKNIRINLRSEGPIPNPSERHQIVDKVGLLAMRSSESALRAWNGNFFLLFLPFQIPNNSKNNINHHHANKQPPSFEAIHIDTANICNH